MSVLYLVRHGQASFLADDYDQLSDRGWEQARRLGEFWAEHQIEVDEVYTGSLQRQRQTATGIGERLHAAGFAWPAAEVIVGLNEYDAEPMLRELRMELVEKHRHVRELSEQLERACEGCEYYRAFHRLFAAVMEFYIAGNYESQGFETWREFHDRVTWALHDIRSRPGHGRRIAVVTSGGPIGVSVQTTLQAPERQAGEVNWRVYNASVTQFTFRADRISLDQFNSIAHLGTRELQTYR